MLTLYMLLCSFLTRFEYSVELALEPVLNTESTHAEIANSLTYRLRPPKLLVLNKIRNGAGSLLSAVLFLTGCSRFMHVPI